jgi:2-hydroxychromene-2-carboxylate isomerase
MRGAIAAQELGVFDTYVDQVFADMWLHGLDLGQAGIVGQSLTEPGLPTEQIFAWAQSAAVKQQLLDYTQATFADGALGSPSFMVGNALFFGKDRLVDVKQEVLRAETQSV